MKTITRWLPVVLLGLMASGRATAQVEKAEQALRDLEYPAALKALDAAAKQPGNDRATTLRITELLAITLATLGQDAKALRAFQVLLTLNPDFKLAGSYPPRVTTAFYEARGWAGQNKPLTARQLPAVTKAGFVTLLQVELQNDPLKLVKEVRFVVSVDGTLTSQDVAVTGGLVVAPASEQRLSWWAVLLGEKRAVLKELGAADNARIEAAAPLPVAARTKEPVPDLKPQPTVEPIVVAKEEPALTAWEAPPPQAAPLGGKKVASIALMGGGVAVAAVGVVFGVLANGTKVRVTGAETDASGRVTGLTQREALMLDAQQRTEASLANVFIISGAALAAGGVTLLLLSGGDTSVSLAPAAGGARLVGTF